MPITSLQPTCPSCSEKTGFKSFFKMKEGMVKCPSCQHEFHISGREIDPDDFSYKNMDVPPNGIREINNITSIEIILGIWSRRTLSSFISGLFFLAIILSVFGKDWRFAEFDPNDKTTWIPLGIIAFFILLGLLPFLVRKKIIVDRQKLEIDVFPRKLFLKNREYLVNDIAQIFTEKQVKRSGKGNRNKRTVFHVKMNLKNNKGTVFLMKNLVSPAPAYYIEKRIENYLKIKDERVEGEFDVRKNFNLSSSGGRYGLMKGMMHQSMRNKNEK